MPRCFFSAVGSVRTRQKIQSAYWPSVVQVFWPLTTHSSPSRTAVVRSEARSEPASGSEKPWHHQMSRFAVFGRNAPSAPASRTSAITGPTMLALNASGGGHAGQLHLLVPDVALQRRPVPAAPLDRPVRHGEPGGVERLLGRDELLLGQLPVVGDGVADLLGHLGGEEGPHLLAERCVLRGQLQPHRSSFLTAAVPSRAVPSDDGLPRRSHIRY